MKILVVDDELDILETVQDILQDEGFAVTLAENAIQANKSLVKEQFDLILLDIWMPDTDGISLLKQWVAESLKTPVVMMSGHGTVETAVEATKLGASDFLEKPLSLAKLLSTIESVLKDTQNIIQTQAHLVELPIGKSEVITELKDSALKIAKTQSNVLIFGALGSGKKAFANYIHQNSLNKNKIFMIVANDNNERELFDLLEKSQQGILIIDEVSAFNSRMQDKLAYALKNQNTKSRIISLSQVDLNQQVQQGLFLESLFYLLSETTLQMPSLLTHLEDIPDILNYYVDLLCETEGLAYRKIPFAVQNYLINFSWTGQQIQVKNLVRELLVLEGGEVSIEEIKKFLLNNNEMSQQFDFEMSLKEARSVFDKKYFEHHLKIQKNNMSKVAKIADIERTTLYRTLKKIGISK
jgi:DNA-binding NtrC family response regulator